MSSFRARLSIICHPLYSAQHPVTLKTFNLVPVGLADNVLRSTIHRQWNRSSGTITSMRNIINTIISPVAASRRVLKHCSTWGNTDKLITIRHVAGTMNLQKRMVVCNRNAHSVRNKTTVICDYICDHNVDLMALTEHWLTPKESAVKTEICPDGYSVFVTKDQIAIAVVLGYSTLTRMKPL